MADDFEGIMICSGSFIEDPCIVNGDVGGVYCSDVGVGLDDQVLLVDSDVDYVAVFDEGVFGDEEGSARGIPVDLVNTVAIS